jgi:hypothetical protein
MCVYEFVEDDVRRGKLDAVVYLQQYESQDRIMWNIVNNILTFVYVTNCELARMMKRGKKRKRKRETTNVLLNTHIF